MLGEIFLSKQGLTSLRYIFENGHEEETNAERVVVGGGLCSHTENIRGGTDIGLSEIECTLRVVAVECDHVTVGAGVLQVKEASFSGFFPRVSDGFRTERSRYYPNQSAKTLLTGTVEHYPPTYLDPTHITASLCLDQMIQFARAVVLELALSPYGVLEDMLLKTNVGQSVVSRPYRASQSPYPIRLGSTVWKVSRHGQVILCQPSPRQVNMLLLLLGLWVRLMSMNDWVFVERKQLRTKEGHWRGRCLRIIGPIEG